MKEFQKKLRILNFIPDNFSKFELFKILNKIPVPMAMTDGSQNIIFANQELLHLGGYTDLKNTSCEHSFCRGISCTCPELAQEKTSNKIKTEFVKRDNSRAIVNQIAHKFSLNNTEYLLIFFIDITKEEQHKSYQNLIITEKSIAENKAIKEAEKFEFLFDNITDAVFLLNKNGDFVKTNKKALDHLGYSTEELLRLNVSDIHVSKNDKFVNSTIEKIKTHGHVIFETKHITKTGAVKYVEVSSSCIHLGDEDYFFSSVRDISQRKKLEQELILSKEKAQESNKLKSAFLNIISHQIRTPLNGMLGFVDFLENEYETLTPEQRRDYFNVIRESGSTLLNQVEEILEVSKLNSGSLEFKSDWFELKILLEEIIETIKLKYQNNQNTFSFKLNANLTNISLKTDKNMLRRVITNLLDNVFKHNTNKHVTFDVRPCADRLYFTFEDNGSGIPEKFMDRIFEPFTKVHESFNIPINGNGLGLPISKKLVEYLGGDLKVKSSKDHGTAFYFFIPFLGEHAPLKLKNENTDKKTLLGKTILIAEDDPITFKLLEKTLKAEGCRTLHAQNGKLATEYCNKDKSINLVIMDLNMPIMDGLEATNIIKKKFPWIPIVAHTAFAHDNCKENYKQYGFNAFLTKPTNKQNLLDTLKAHIKI